MQLVDALPRHRATGDDEAVIEAQLARAVARDQLALDYQPRIRLRGRKLAGVEALARWPHRQRGMVSPSVFIGIAERSDLIVKLGHWVLRRACCEAAGWPGDLKVSVNVSARQLASGLLLDQLRQALAESALPPERLELELTESLLVGLEVETLLTLSAIRDLGVGLALDDFGTGYASLSVLKALPLSVLKLDKSMVRGVSPGSEDAAIAGAVVAVARALGLEVVAEGLQSEMQCDLMAELGCLEGQSFFLGRPASADRITELAMAAPRDAGSV